MNEKQIAKVLVQKLLDMGAISQVDYDTSVQNYNLWQI